MLFGVKSPFTKVPLDCTIYIFSKRIYENKDVETSAKKLSKEILLLCTKKNHFTFESKNCLDTDGAAMCSFFGPVTLMIELEK